MVRAAGERWIDRNCLRRLAAELLAGDSGSRLSSVARYSRDLLIKMGRFTKAREECNHNGAKPAGTGIFDGRLKQIEKRPLVD